MSNILFVGDVACSSGFGRASAGFLPALHDRHKVTAIGVNYRGTKHDLPFWVHPAHLFGHDPIGLSSMAYVLPEVKPDLVVVQTNPWHVPHYAKTLHKLGFGDVPIVGIIAVEGKNVEGRQLNYLKRAIFWNQFGADEAIKGGYTRPYGIVPLGVDLNTFYPDDKETARQFLGLPDVPPGSFIVGNVNRNQYRKRLDLSVMYFAEWIQRYNIRDAYLYLHLLPGSTVAIDVDQLAYYTGCNERVIHAEPKDMYNGAPTEYLRATYQAFDLQISTALGEGWGLTTMEGMASGVPQIAGDYAALGEWAKDAIKLVPCSVEGVMPDVKTMIGGVPDKEAVISALQAFYENNSSQREYYAHRGLECVQQPQYRWEHVAQRFAEEIESVL